MFDIHGVLKDLSKHRPIFCSEADFQDALAWQIHEAMPDCEIGSLQKKEIPDLCIPSERIAKAKGLRDRIASPSVSKSNRLFGIKMPT